MAWLDIFVSSTTRRRLLGVLTCRSVALICYHRVTSLCVASYVRTKLGEIRLMWSSRLAMLWPSGHSVMALIAAWIVYLIGLAMYRGISTIFATAC